MSGERLRKSILIVDDDAQFSLSLQRILAKAGFKTASVDSGIEALDRLGSGSFDLVITDYLMGRVSGLELISLIRSRQMSVKVLLLTAHGGENSAPSSWHACADACLAKPARRDEILRCVSRLLSDKFSNG